MPHKILQYIQIQDHASLIQLIHEPYFGKHQNKSYRNMIDHFKYCMYHNCYMPFQPHLVNSLLFLPSTTYSFRSKNTRVQIKPYFDSVSRKGIWWNSNLKWQLEIEVLFEWRGNDKLVEGQETLDNKSIKSYFWIEVR